MATTYTSPIFCGQMAGKLTQFDSTAGTTIADITTADANGPIRIDSLSASIDDVVQAYLRLTLSDGTNAYALGVVALDRPVKNIVTNESVEFTWAATTITASGALFISGGLKVGDSPIITGCPDSANDLNAEHPITTLTDTVLTMSAASMTSRSATYGKCKIGVAAETPAMTDLLAASELAGLVGQDAAGNAFLELPQGWKLQAALLALPTSDNVVNVQARWGTYASAS